MNNRIHALFDRKQKNILSVYFTAGHPELNDTLPLIKHLEKAGVDMIEVGFPFSDPLADGPVIQQSSLQAIHNKMNLKLLFSQLVDLRRHSSIPIILMGYINPVMQFGEIPFLEACKDIGIDGIIIPDMPVDYYLCHLQSKCIELNISNILLITPQTNDQRILDIDNNSEGFIYMVSDNSITGSNKKTGSQTEYFERIKNLKLKNPTLIGFGIHNQESFHEVCQYSSGAIIGSAFISHITKYGTNFSSINNFIKSIRP